MKNNLLTNHVILVMPLYSNTEIGLRDINSKCLELVKGAPLFRWTIVIVNDGSPQYVSRHYLRQYLSADIDYHYYHYPSNRGKGYAVRFGVSQFLHADYYVYCDADFPFGINSVVQAVAMLKHADIVAADRGKDYCKQLPFLRRAITQCVRKVNRYLFGMICFETQAGLKGMTRRAVRVLLDTSCDGFLFDWEFIREAETKKLAIMGLPVTCKDDLQLSNFSLQVIFREIVHALKLFTFFHRGRSTENVAAHSIHYSTTKEKHLESVVDNHA